MLVPLPIWHMAEVLKPPGMSSTLIMVLQPKIGESETCDFAGSVEAIAEG